MIASHASIVRARHRAAVIAILLLGSMPACAAPAVTAPVLVTSAQEKTMSADWSRYPLFRAEVERAQAFVHAELGKPIAVPVPKDPAGGYTDNQHRLNWRVIEACGQMYRLTGDKACSARVKDLLLAYADLYPKLGPHPAARNESVGRLFWQSLNDANWVVFAVQGYDAIRATLNDSDRTRIDAMFRQMSEFLAGARDFDRIHNHGTWAAAAVGMTGYVIRDPSLVKKGLYGSDGSGKAGFLKQLAQLFAPDGYYTEGPYYERYAILPAILLANAIEANEPARRIFALRDGILLKAVRADIQQSYDGYFFPLNDSLKDKGYWTGELYAGIAVAYARTHDDSLLSIAASQNRTVLTPEGLETAKALAEGRAKPFPYQSTRFVDGAKGDQGELVIFRSEDKANHSALVVKNTSQGMDHGHFDKLHYMFYDNGEEVITDYGAARYLNIEEKDGGRYLPLNKSYAKQTVAHNTLVVNEQSHFGAKLDVAEKYHPTPLIYAVTDTTKITAARMDNAYPGVSFTRVLATVSHPDLDHPVVVDLLKVHGDKPAQYDLPLHFRGQIMTAGFPVARHLTERPALGKKNGFENIWVDGIGEPTADNATFDWLLNRRFYTYRFLPATGSKLVIGEIGANDPSFDLRHEPLIVQRVTAADADFVGVLEPHGDHNPSAETTSGEKSSIAKLEHFAGNGADIVRITTTAGHHIVLGVAFDGSAKAHSVAANGKTYSWTGAWYRGDE
jgi:hypothetical protein